MTTFPSHTIAHRRTTVAMKVASATAVWPYATTTYGNYRRAPSRYPPVIARTRAGARAERD